MASDNQAIINTHIHIVQPSFWLKLTSNTSFTTIDPMALITGTSEKNVPKVTTTVVTFRTFFSEVPPICAVYNCILY
jgi:hypothetical protein